MTSLNCLFFVYDKWKVCMNKVIGSCLFRLVNLNFSNYTRNVRYEIGNYIKYHPFLNSDSSSRYSVYEANTCILFPNIDTR